MSDSDRELYFSDFVIELQTAEDEKRRRIRDARRRAEKAQRDAYREALRDLAVKGKLLPSTRWRAIEETISAEASFKPVKEQDREAPREIFEDFMDVWNEVYRRDRSFLSRLVNPTSKKGISIKLETKYDDFCKALLDESAHSAELYSDTRQILNSEEPVSSARLYFNEIVGRASESQGIASRRRSSVHEDSSEDEGEIIEDGEITDETPVMPVANEKPAATNDTAPSSSEATPAATASEEAHTVTKEATSSNEEAPTVNEEAPTAEPVSG